MQRDKGSIQAVRDASIGVDGESRQANRSHDPVPAACDYGRIESDCLYKLLLFLVYEEEYQYGKDCAFL